jgi:GrpB-like predicted nucleotidyltransferase (UPF0157 family)
MDPPRPDPELAARLASAGVDDIDDPKEAWDRLHAGEGRRATLIDRYAVEAAARDVTIAELSEDDKARFRREVLEAQYPGIELLGGGRRDPIEVVPYDPEWVRRFAAWRDRLTVALGPAATRIDHIGSTSVPGLAAKPVIDVQVSVHDLHAEASYVPAIEALEVPLRARDPDHRYFRPPPGRPRDVQIHVCRSGSTWERDHLLFRDYLRADADLRGAYGGLKLELAERFHDDRLAYNESKTVFILDALSAAEVWAAATGWAPGTAR